MPPPEPTSHSPATALPARRADADRYLSDGARARILEGVADNTRSAYDRQWARFADWCAEHGRTAPPATPETLAEFVVTLIDAGKGVPTISQAIATVRTRHRLAGYPDAPNADAARLALRTHRREVADAGGRPGRRRRSRSRRCGRCLTPPPADTAAGEP